MRKMVEKDYPTFDFKYKVVRETYEGGYKGSYLIASEKDYDAACQIFDGECAMYNGRIKRTNPKHRTRIVIFGWAWKVMKEAKFGNWEKKISQKKN